MYSHNCIAQARLSLEPTWSHKLHKQSSVFESGENTAAYCGFIILNTGFSASKSWFRSLVVKHFVSKNIIYTNIRHSSNITSSWSNHQIKYGTRVYHDKGIHVRSNHSSLATAKYLWILVLDCRPVGSSLWMIRQWYCDCWLLRSEVGAGVWGTGLSTVLSSWHF